MNRIAAVVLVAFMALCLSACAQSSVQIVLDRTKLGQAISGWEVTPRFWEFDKRANRYDATWLEDRDEIVRALVDQAGITRVRIEVRSGVENPIDYWSQFIEGRISYEEGKRHYYEKINDNVDPHQADPAGFQWSSFDYYVTNFVLPLRTRIAAQGGRLVINLCYVDFRWTDLKGNFRHADAPEEYAELLSLAALRLKDHFGLDIDYLEIILEPDNTDGWTGEAIGRAMLATKARLSSHGITPKFIAPSPAAASATPRLLEELQRVPGASAALDVVSYHRYDRQAADQAVPIIRDLAFKLSAETEMLEYVDGDVDNLFDDMTFGGASAWQLYGAATTAESATNAKPGYLLVRNPSHEITLTPRTAQLAVVMRNVRPGARAITASIDSNTTQVLAFRNIDGTEVIALHAPNAMHFELQNVLPGRYQASYALASGKSAEQLSLLIDAKGLLALDIPEAGVVVLQSQSADARQ